MSHEFGPEDARRFYDRFGAWQDSQFYESAAVTYLVAHADFEAASAVFELGCGTGKLAERLLTKHLADNATYAGIDISPTMVQIAAPRLARWAGRARVTLGDGTARLPYPDGAFDRFIATYVLDLLPRPAITHVLTEARRLLHPRGKLCVVSLTEGVTGVSHVLTSVWRRVHAFDPRLVGGCRPLRPSELLDPAAWKIEHAHVVCSWGICSEVLIGSPA